MTRLMPRSAWRYGVLIVILFAIAALTAGLVIARLEAQIAPLDRQDIIWQLNASVWSLTMGFMFLAGALGLWAIRSTVEIESRRRIGRFVDDMDYLSDGLVVLDKNGAIIGSNPAFKTLLSSPEGRQPSDIYEAFPFLPGRDAESLLRSAKPCEINSNFVRRRGWRALRLRSQPAEGVVLVLVSDVTEARSHEIRQKQVAQLQLVGRIAGGVAADFSDILCAISGHSALLERQCADSAQVRDSLNMIVSETRRGSHLSRLLLDLSRSGEPSNPSESLGDDVNEAGSLLRVALSPGWTVRISVSGKFETVPLTSAQIGQVVLNLGLLAADARPRAGTVMITLDQPGQEHLLSVEDHFAAVILISAHDSVEEEAPHIALSAESVIPMDDETGVILSVVRSIVEEVGGRIDRLSAPRKLCIYRVCLPRVDSSQTGASRIFFPPSELNAYVSRWRILLAAEDDRLDALAVGLRSLGAAAEQKADIASLLAGLQSAEKTDAIVLDEQVLGTESRSVLAAIARLAPDVGIIVLCSDTEAKPPLPHSPAVYERYGANSPDIIRAMVNAKALARKRKTFTSHSEVVS